MMQPLRIKHTSQGFTLIELMVAMLLGLFLIYGLVQIFISSKQSYRMQETLSRLQENGRFALDFINRDIRMAGYRGCASKSKAIPNNLLINKTAYNNDFTSIVQGFNNIPATWTGASTGLNANPPFISGSDVITIRRGSDDGAQITLHPSGAPPNGSGNLTLGRDTVPGLQVCDVVMASDCQSTSIFQITSNAINNITHATGGCAGTPAGGNATTALGKSYKGGNLYKLVTTSYYLKTNLNDQPALFRKVNTNPEEELVEGVEQMQIFFGTDTDADGFANTYLKASLVTNWQNVVSVRINLLVRTVEDNIASEVLTYSFNGVNNINPGDRRIRHVFTTTVAIRNKLY